MPVPTETIVDAFAQGDWRTLSALVDGWPAAAPQRPVLQSMALFLQTRHGSPRDCQRTMAALPEVLEQALAVSSPEADLAACLLAIAFRLSLDQDDRQRCEGSLRLLDDLAPRLQCIRAQILPPRLGYWLAERTHDARRQVRCAESALALPGIQQGSDLWLEFTEKLARAATAMMDHHRVADLLSALAPHASGMAERIGTDYVGLRLRYLEASGQFTEIREEFRAAADQGGDPFSQPHWPHYLVALIHAGERAAVEALLKRLERRLAAPGLRTGERPALRRVFHQTRCLLALSRRQFAHARDHLQRAEEGQPSTGHAWRRTLSLALAIALAEGRASRARHHLDSLDPNQDRGDLHLEWLRWELLRGDEPAARERLRVILRQQLPSAVEAGLRFAWELPSWKLARLWMSACGSAVDDPSPPQLGEPAPGTHPSAGQPPDIAKQRQATSLIGTTPAMQAVHAAIDTYAPLSVPVLVQGETGTGKECVARLLHERGSRPTEPFLAVNCAAVSDTLAEAELFGHVRGAFTGAIASKPGLLEAAGAGSLFLDEITSMSPRLQGVLLRVLETGDYRPIGGTRTCRSRARIIVASGEPLARAVADGRFRQDLRFRLERFVVVLPPLRERLQDIPALCQHFIANCAPERRVRPSDEFLRRAMGHSWPGNVRELRNHIERLVVLHPTGATLPAVALDDAAPPSAVPDAAATTAPRAPGAASPVPVPGRPTARERRHRILAAMAENPHLYRADVIALLRCSPSTATADLQALEDAGLIRRVITSANLRTSYFVRCTSAVDRSHQGGR